MEFKEKVSYKEFFEISQAIYNSLADKESKEIFKKRMEASSVGHNNLEVLITRTPSSYWDEPRHLELFHELCQTFDSIYNEEIIFYGAGVLAKKILQFFCINYRSCPNLIFCDQNSSSKLFANFMVISPDELLAKHRNKKIIITTFDYREDVYDFLVKNGIDEKNITKGISHEIQYKFMFEWYHHATSTFKLFDDTKMPKDPPNCTFDDINQYFDKIITYGENEVFVDAGVFDGNTSFQFAKRCPNYQKIYLFEPDPDSYANTIENIQDRGMQNAEIFNVGLFGAKTVMQFSRTQASVAGHRIQDTGEYAVEVDTLDNYFIHNLYGDLLPPTFIKMDIEGAELAALGGGC